MAEARKEVGEMLGETMREAGLLVLVFGVLDGLATGKPDQAELWIGASIGLSLVLIASGIVMERLR